jgi:hypothetical protein
MRLSATPDISGRRAMLLAALAVMAVVGGTMLLKDTKNLALALGDTDDATRLILVRSLIHGAGWYDQLLTRFSPPEGVYMHWSRLMDGGLYALNRLFALFTDDARAETLMRMIWPLLWIPPAALAVLYAARRFGPSAVFAGLVVLLTDGMLYAQFHPGRVDHHSAQIAFCMIALAGALQTGPRLWGSLIAGAAIGVGLGVGLEALAFNILIGASFGLRFLIDAREGRQAQAFGAALAASSVAVFVIQTPPWRWGVAACDALAINTTVGLGIAGVGIVLAVWATRDRPLALRLLGIGLAGVAAAGAYLWIDPACIHGPFAEVDERIKPFWLNNVSEVLPLARIARNKPAEATEMIASFTVATLAWLWLGGRKENRTDLGWLLLGALLISAMVSGALAVRMQNYAQWFAAPIVAAAAADIARRYSKDAMLATAAAALALSPVVAATASAYSYNRIFPPKAGRKTPKDFCFNTSSYRELAKLPPGLVLSDIDLGPFIVAHTPHNSVAAPYHRLSRGILATRGVLAGRADGEAEQRARALGVTYILGCRAHAINADRTGLANETLVRHLDAGKPPAWLERLSKDKAAIDVYRVKPPQSPSRAANASAGAQAGSKT